MAAGQLLQQAKGWSCFPRYINISLIHILKYNSRYEMELSTVPETDLSDLSVSVSPVLTQAIDHQPDQLRRLLKPDLVETLEPS